jgi:hypothetical protein
MASVHQISQNDSKWSSASGRETNTNSSEQGWGLPRFIAAWHAFRESFAPLGYEDETGFHYGDRREKN